MSKMPQMARDGKNQHGNPRPKVICVGCKNLLPQNLFSYKIKNDPSQGIRDRCKKCSSIKAEKERERRKNNWKYQPTLAMLNNSKQRAKKAGLEHTITVNDIVKYTEGSATKVQADSFILEILGKPEELIRNSFDLKGVYANNFINMKPTDRLLRINEIININILNEIDKVAQENNNKNMMLKSERVEIKNRFNKYNINKMTVKNIGSS